MTDLILTNYFTTKPDPQSGKFRPSGDMSLINPWVDSVLRLNLQAVIFYDEPMSPTTINGNIKLVRYDLQTCWSVNDERFLCWYQYIHDHQEVERVFLTDLFDVEFFRNPFELITPENHLYVGIGVNPNKPLGQNKWMRQRFLDAYGAVSHAEKIVPNAGVIGGDRDNVLNLLCFMLNDFREADTDKNINMAVFTKNLYDLYPVDRLVVGPPVTSRFKKYEQGGDFAIRHK